jgi:hypothetical protein
MSTVRCNRGGFIRLTALCFCRAMILRLSVIATRRNDHSPRTLPHRKGRAISMELRPAGSSPTVSVNACKIDRYRGHVRILGLAVSTIAVLSLWIWGLRRVDELPDVGEPFNLDEIRRPVAIPDPDNAFVAYAEAKRQKYRYPAFLRKVDFKTLAWSEASAEVRDCVEKSRPALETWREASERTEALYHQPGNMTMDTMVPLVQDASELGRLAALEGSRLEENGEMDRAWPWYRAILRTSRHIGRHGVIIERLYGANAHLVASHRILHWAADPRVNAALLRQALDDTLAADALTPRLSESLKRDYLAYARDLDELRVIVQDIPMPGGRSGWLERVVIATGLKVPIQRLRLAATNDIERSRRAVRLMFANWLAQVDRPASQRAPIAVQKPMLIYEFEPTSQAAARGVDAEILDRALDHTALAQQIFHPDDLASQFPRTPWEGDGPLAREPRRRGILIVKLAAELYLRERGQPPATAGLLLGGYLDLLPEGIEQGDPIPVKLE